MEDARAGGQNPADREATSQAEGHDLLSGEDPREHLEHGSKRTLSKNKKKVSWQK